MTALHKVLVVDDDPVVGKSFDRVLSSKGYAVITAKNGEEALNKLATEKYDVIYTDIRMPGISGLEVAEHVKANRPWTPVVIITGYGSEESETRAKAAGVVGFLHKPLSPAMIEGSASKALETTTFPEAVIESAATEAPPGKDSTLKNVALFFKNVVLFFAAPFIGLAYIIAFPVVGIAMLMWIGLRAAAARGLPKMAIPLIKNVGLFAAAPFIGLIYIIAFPAIGLAMLAWMGARALLNREKTT